MTSLAKTFFFVAATVAYAFYGFSLAGDDAPIRIDGRDLLSNPSEYNGKLVRVYGLVHSDFEHFNLRFKCKGYILDAHIAKKFNAGKTEAGIVILEISLDADATPLNLLAVINP